MDPWYWWRITCGVARIFGRCTPPWLASAFGWVTPQTWVALGLGLVTLAVLAWRKRRTG